jgi:ribose transport system substrate-binding protein
MKHSLVTFILLLTVHLHASSKEIAYMVSDIRIPFWEIMSRGIIDEAKSLGYRITIYSANNLLKKELQNSASILQKSYDGVLLSPISSSSAVTVLRLLHQKNIPTIVLDIGSDSDNYLSYISSDNTKGAYEVGEILANAMKQRGWERKRVGIIAIPQKRTNGKARTQGFLQAMKKHRIEISNLYQQVDFSCEESYQLAQKLLQNDPHLNALWIQGSDRYRAVLRAIKESKREKEVLLLTFDAEPEFLEMIPQGGIVGTGMQQPYLMGEESIRLLDRALRHEKIPKEVQLSILAISSENIQENLPTIKRNVLGITP